MKPRKRPRAPGAEAAEAEIPKAKRASKKAAKKAAKTPAAKKTSKKVAKKAAKTSTAIRRHIEKDITREVIDGDDGVVTITTIREKKSLSGTTIAIGLASVVIAGVGTYLVARARRKPEDDSDVVKADTIDLSEPDDTSKPKDTPKGDTSSGPLIHTPGKIGKPGSVQLPKPTKMGKVPEKYTQIYQLLNELVEDSANWWANVAAKESGHNFMAANPKGAVLSESSIVRQMEAATYGDPWDEGCVLSSGAFFSIPYTAYAERTPPRRTPPRRTPPARTRPSRPRRTPPPATSG
ncbi:MAG: hypothetical protein R3B09_20150 [Nannocystaceae bacterium]